MAACLLVTLPLEFVLGARVYRRLSSLLFALVPVVLVFSVWDVIGIVAHHWSYNPRFVTGIRLLFEMPLEELVFFVVIPICGLLTYEAVGQVMHRFRRPGSSPDPGAVPGGSHQPLDAGASRDA